LLLLPLLQGKDCAAAEILTVCNVLLLPLLK
jgi:hypothetical protein